MIDHELKLRRAHHHLEDLDRVVGSWSDEKHYSVRYEYEPDRKWDGPIPPGRHKQSPDGARWYLDDGVALPGLPAFNSSDAVFGQGVLTAYVTAEQPPSDPISLLIGDVLHNFRSALDLLAFALANGYTKPLPKQLAERSEFPIFGDEDGEGNRGVGSMLFHEMANNGKPTPRSGFAKIAGWHPDAQTAVERLQPYQRGNDFRSDPLWLLHELDRISKHRLLHVGAAVTVGVDFRWPMPLEHTNVRAIGPGFIEAIAGPVDTDTPVTRWWGVHRIHPEGEVKMQIHPSMQVAFRKEAVGGQKKLVVPTLAQLYNYIVREILPAVAPYL